MATESIAALFALLTCASLLALLRLRAEAAHLRAEIGRLRAAAEDRDRAEAANRAKSRFVATVSHEIRTPLNGVMGLAQILSMTRLDAEQASYVEAIRDSSRSLARLIDDILDFSRIEAGKLDLRREAFALAPLVESVVELLAPRAFSKGLEIAAFISPETPRLIESDAARLRQILTNLIGNALNCVIHGGVGVRALHVEGDLRLEVRDTGPGVPEAFRETIFQEFERVDASPTRRQGGAGLGLAISRRLAAQMGGRLWLAETSPAGSTFCLTLPALACANQTRAQRPLSGRRILIVAESRFEAPYMKEALVVAGAQAQIAAPEGARSLLSGSDRGPDTVIVDCALGAEVLALMSRLTRAGGARRLFLLFSPYERRALGKETMQDFDGWLVKPVRGASLVSTMFDERPEALRPSQLAPAPLLEDLDALVADDNEVNALILSRFLERLGARVARARDGAEAVAMACWALDGARGYRVILMDLFMPEVDGREATRRIREAELCARAPRTPIIAITASAQEEDERAARAAGVDAFLTKPVELAALASAIRALCGPLSEADERLDASSAKRDDFPKPP